MAREWLVRNRPDRVLDELDRLHGDEAVSLRAYRLRAEALNRLDREDDAVLVAKQGLGLHGPDTVLFHVLGEALTYRHRLDEAERAYLDGLALDPHDVSLLCGYAFLCATVGQFEKARRLLDRAAAIDPHRPSVARYRAIAALAQGDYRKADQHISEMLRRDPENVEGHVVLAMTAAHRGDLRTASRSSAWAASQAPEQNTYVELAREARAADHWALRPLWPIRKLGPIGSWLAVHIGVFVLVGPLGLVSIGVALLLCWFLLCVYSWVAPPLVRWWERRR